MGRHSSYTKAIADEIIERLSKGEPLEQICRDEHMPATRTVHDWSGPEEHRSVEVSADFPARFVRARDLGHDAIAADCLRIADNTLEGVTTITQDDGKVEERRGDMLGHRKLQIETRLKLLAKWNPKKYGDRLELENKHSGGIKVVAAAPEDAGL